MTKVEYGSSSLHIFILPLCNTYKDLFLTYKVQNKEVIKAIFIGKILVWDRSNSDQKYEIKVEGVEEFVDNKTGKVIKAKSLSGVCIALVGGGSYSGWEELEVCLNPKEGF
ncbi:hypothetical protein wVul_0240 [Wolbachia endosymbiont of Armadillidium vulgare str. wVulC]|uniref:Uncharacterized protein n=1 Tax=Wolbachia endosymbiont of Armadillidium arcangelii TaxID=3158571 RepID=A0AAU7Q3Q1_9RICK|nr:hypothetical protein [Wolbachia endosymbiont of Armadillidium vulgare]KLT23037.1 hypothetical protein wVul_0240 [Wolbachia endosymbiont of Armadillidium vulgare str. wVulC]